MYILQNALLNLVRNKGRNIMIGAIIFAIILTTVVALIISNTAAAVIEDYKGRFGLEVFIKPDSVKLREEAMKNSVGGKFRLDFPEISSQQIIEFANSEYLKESVATGSATGNSTQIRAIDQTDESGTGTTGGQTVMIAGGNGNYALLGDKWSDFSDGLRSIRDDGRLPEKDGECVISTDLQEENNISIGDTLLFTANMSIPTPEDIGIVNDGDVVEVNGTEYNVSISRLGTVNLQREVEYSLTVVGIYDDLTDEYPNPNMPKMALMNRRNEILITLGTLLAQRGADEIGVSINVTYYLKNPDMLTDFEAEVRGKGLSDLFIVGTDVDSYNNIVKPVVGLKSISITFMLVVIVLGGIILLLLTSISIRERKYEIGVLRAMGMKKGKVALGLWTEILAITCICLVIGLGVGMAVAQPISDELLKGQVAAAEAGAQQGPGGITVGGPGGGPGMMGSGGFFMNSSTSSVKSLSEMKITLDPATIIEIIAISILLASFAGLVSISKITKYEPIKILMERN